MNCGTLNFGDISKVVKGYASVGGIIVKRRSLRYRLSLYDEIGHASMVCETKKPLNAINGTLGTSVLSVTCEVVVDDDTNKTITIETRGNISSVNNNKNKPKHKSYKAPKKLCLW
jgi:hypothetical protein